VQVIRQALKERNQLRIDQSPKRLAMLRHVRPFAPVLRNITVHEKRQRIGEFGGPGKNIELRSRTSSLGSGLFGDWGQIALSPP
jgi:hypothetical protein